MGRATAVVCDTTAYLPTELVESSGIHRVSLYVTLDGQEEREIDMPDFNGFYDRLRGASDAATTSQPSLGDFIEVYEPLLADDVDIVSIHLSGAVSGTCEAARQAAERLSQEDRGGERIHIVDSRSGAGGLGLVVLAAVAAAAKGGAGETVAERAEEARRGLKIWFAVDSLEYLRRGGRIGAASAWIGSALKIKPILTLEEEITPVERVRTRSRALERLVDYARERHDAGADAWCVQHIQDPDAAHELARRAAEVFGNEPLFVSEVGPVIGAHTGPGVLGIGSIPTSMLE